MKLEIGQQVRLVHESASGRITAIDGDVIEVEIEDGFRIQVMRKEVAPIAAEEKNRFEEPILSVSRAQEEGILPEHLHELLLLRLKPFNDQFWDLIVQNKGSVLLLFSLLEKRATQVVGISFGTLKAGEQLNAKRYSIAELLEPGSWILQGLAHPEKNEHLPQPFAGSVNWKSVFKRSAGNAEIKLSLQSLKQEQVIAPTQEKSLNPEAIQIEKPGSEVDLHMEKISADGAVGLSPDQCLQLQLQHFENTLEKAIALNMPAITFIHGVGNGRLRTEIQKRLSKEKRIAHFKDADKQKFGYGATLVQIAG